MSKKEQLLNLQSLRAYQPKQGGLWQILEKHQTEAAIRSARSVTEVPQDKKPSGFSLSRRSVLKLASASAAAVSAAAIPSTIKAAGAVLQGPFKLKLEGDQRTPSKVTFSLGDRARWVIDLNDFSPASTLRPAKISVEQTERLLKVRLVGAYYPGTTLPADFVLNVQPGVLECRMHLRMSLGRFDAVAPFERWLAGEAEATSKVSLKASAISAHSIEIGEAAKLHLFGDARASFKSDWTTRFTGNDIALVHGIGDNIRSSICELGLEKSAPRTKDLATNGSLLAIVDTARTIFSIDRGATDWRVNMGLDPVSLDGGSPVSWGISQGAEPFDRIRIETSRDASGAVTAALLAEGMQNVRDENSAPQYYFDAPMLRSVTGGAFAIGLASPRFAIVTRSKDSDAGAREERALLASFHSKSQWLSNGGCMVELGGAENLPPFEIFAVDGHIEHLHCEPSLIKASVPLKGAIAEPFEFHEGARMAFATSPESIHGELHPQLGMVLLDGDGLPAENPMRFPANVIISVVRPDDLLVLKFELINFVYRSTGDTDATHNSPVLWKVKGKGDFKESYLVVHFPPQHIGEQAFYEVTQNPASGKDDKGNPLPPNPSNELPPFPPFAQSRLAGPSRLAFWIPETVKEIPFTLQGLLDWDHLVPSVVPVALPPPAPPIQLYLYLPITTLGSKYAVKSGSAYKAIGNTRIQKGGPVEFTAPILADVSHSPGFAVTIDQNASSKATSKLMSDSHFSAGNTKHMSKVANLYAARATEFDSSYEFAAGLFVIPTIRKPELWETSLETPYRLIISPNRFSGWAHAKKPVFEPTPAELGDYYNNPTPSKTKWAELWHTRLGIRNVDSKSGRVFIDEQDDYYRTVRAVWSPDYDPTRKHNHYNSVTPTPHNPFRMSLDEKDRHELVALTSDFFLDNTDERIVRAERLMLSSLGAYMNTRGAWDIPLSPGYAEPLSIEEWRHRSAMGRDNYVRVVYKGFLFPFGHRASLVKITERKFVPRNGYMTAYLRQRMYIIVRQPEKVYPADFQQFEGRRLPFKRIRITTLTTPDVNKPELSQITPTSGQSAFWPQINSPAVDFQFHMVGVDWEGHTIEFTAPLAFIDNSMAYDNSPSLAIGKAMQKYTVSDPVGKTRCQRPVNGQKIAYAESKKAGDTTFETTILTFGAETTKPTVDALTMQKHDQPAFYPSVEVANVTIEAVKQLTGVSGGSPIKYSDVYRDSGWDTGANKGQLFLQMADNTPVGLNFGKGGSGVSTDKIGGLVNPSQSIMGLSRLSGPVSASVPSDLGDIIGAKFDPKNFFKGLDVKILGGISLLDIVQAVTGLDLSLDNLKSEMESKLGDLKDKVTTAALQALPKSPIPSFITHAIYDTADAVDAGKKAAGDVANGLQIPKQIQIAFKWDPEVDSFGSFKLKSGADKKDILSLTSLLLIPIKPPVIDASDPTNSKPPMPGEPSYIVTARLQNFILDLFDIIAITVNSVSFTKESGKKADVSADIESMEFEGPLAFVNELKNVIPSSGFSDPPSLEVTPTGIRLGYDLALPSISVGAFALTNVSLGAELSLPFTGDPLRFRFHFCTREHPFCLSVYCLGGGGFFGIELGLDGVEMIEASLEFGAELSIDLGVASGSVSIKAGIYFKLEKTPTGDHCQLTGYVRMNGELEVLGIITVSVEFYLALTYATPPSKAWGEATLTVKVEILFFSTSVSMSVRKEFVDPTGSFGQLMSDTEWLDYRYAFAA
jgi:hypothetical protein